MFIVMLKTFDPGIESILALFSTREDAIGWINTEVAQSERDQYSIHEIVDKRHIN